MNADQAAGSVDHQVSQQRTPDQADTLEAARACRDAADEAVTRLKARAALGGYILTIAASSAGEAEYTVHRWTRSRSFATVTAVAEFLDLVEVQRGDDPPLCLTAAQRAIRQVLNENVCRERPIVLGVHAMDRRLPRAEIEALLAEMNEGWRSTRDIIARVRTLR